MCNGVCFGIFQVILILLLVILVGTSLGHTVGYFLDRRAERAHRRRELKARIAIERRDRNIREYIMGKGTK